MPFIGRTPTPVPLTSSDIPDSIITDAKIVGMTSSKLSGALPAISGASLTNIDAGTHVKISATTASGNGYIDFTSGIDSTYKEYLFKFNNIHGANDGTNFRIQFSTDGGSNFDVTNNFFMLQAYNTAGDGGSSIGGETSDDGGGTQYVNLSRNSGNENDESVNGEIKITNPSGSTFFKHYVALMPNYNYANGSNLHIVGGYASTTSAINAVRFLFTAGNIDSGIITLYGVKT